MSLHVIFLFSVDTVMTLLDGITKLTDGEWPPIPIVNHGPQVYNEGPQSQGPGPEGPQKTGPDRKKRKAVPLNDDYGASNDYSQMMKDPGESMSSQIFTLQWRHNGRDGVSTSRLFYQPLIQAQIKENIKAPCHWPLWGEFTGDRGIPRTKGQ